MEIPARRPHLYRLSSPLRFRPSREALLFGGIALVALGLRLWELDGRAMHYDEGIHVHYAWRLASGEGYAHSPWMHGPLQIHLTALMFKLFSDSDVTARLAYALFGAGLVFLPFFLRTYLGKTGAVVTSVLLALSPSLLYFSRFGRNDILMAFFALALLILMWRYLNEGRNRYLYMASAVVALAFATKETAYIIMIIFGAAVFLISLPEIIPWALGRIKTSQLGAAPVFLLLLVTLTLPQWAALVSIPLDGTGLELVSSGTGETGLPVWGAPLVSFPLFGLAIVFKALLLAALVIVPMALTLFTSRGRRWARWVIPALALAAIAYSLVAFPSGEVARSYLISFAALAGLTVVSAIVGLLWNWKVWLICAVIFYGLWVMFYTSIFTAFVQPHNVCPGEVGGGFGSLCSHAGGIYTGSWQALGYWIEQQNVARAEQPWFHYFTLGAVYEFLPLLFGLAAAIYYIRKGEIFGLMLAFWAAFTFAAYTYASEKMPWLLVNITLPAIVLGGKFIGDLIDRVPWKRVLRPAYIAPMVLVPMILLAGAHLLRVYLGQGEVAIWQDRALLGTTVALIAVLAFLLVRPRGRPSGRLVGRSMSATMAALGLAALLLGFSSFVAFRASYSYDDAIVEILVYAQGSHDVVDTVRTLNNGVFDDDGRDGTLVEVDYEMWYPFNWYVRHEQKEGTLQFRCYKQSHEDGYVPWCTPLEEPPSTKAVLLIDSHSNRDFAHLTAYDRAGPFRNLLWFPQSYRRPGESRKSESILEELEKDLAFAKDNITRREPWSDALDYFLFREIGSKWWDSTFYTHVATTDTEPADDAGGG